MSADPLEGRERARQASDTQMERCPEGCGHIIPGCAGVSPCASCGKPMDGAFERLVHAGDWYHEKCFERATPAAPETAPHSDACKECGGTEFHLATCKEGQALAAAIKAVWEYRPEPDMPTEADIVRRKR